MRPPFLIAAGILLLSGIGLQWVIHSFQVFLSKEAIELRRPLYLMPENVGPYILENQEPDLTPEIEAVLGAKAYITREYRDTRLEPQAPGALVRLHVAYWTGTPDTVIHVPEVCYVGGGAQGRQFENLFRELDSELIVEDENGGYTARNDNGENINIPDRKVPLRVFHFVPKGGDKQHTVAYFFTANGSFMGTTERVRTLVFDVRDKYAYWCKVEVLPMEIHDREQAVAKVVDFLSYALPEIMTCLPDWNDVRAGRYP